LIIASLQDFKRREVDNWLNLMILFSGIGFICFSAIFSLNYSVIVYGISLIILMFIAANLFYYGRVFAGGDAKLLFAMSVFLVGKDFFSSMANAGIFLVFVLFSGSIYGIFYSLILFFANFRKTKKEFKRIFENLYLRYSVYVGIILFALSYVDFFFLWISFIFLVMPVLYAFAKSIEKSVMVKELSAKSLREGDLLAEEIRFKNRNFICDWEGLRKADINFLKGYKKKIKIKEGIPFVPAILMAFLFYIPLKDYLFGFLF